MKPHKPVTNDQDELEAVDGGRELPYCQESRGGEKVKKTPDLRSVCDMPSALIQEASRLERRVGLQSVSEKR